MPKRSFLLSPSLSRTHAFFAMFVPFSSVASPALPFGFHQDSLPIPLFAGDSRSSNSIKNMSLRSPKTEVLSPNTMAYAATHTLRKTSLPRFELSYRTNENAELASKSTPTHPQPTYGHLSFCPSTVPPASRGRPRIRVG